jgi:hypothetical protein
MFDTRLPVVFGPLEAAGPEDAILFEDGAPGCAVSPARASAKFAPGLQHAVGCACCGARREAGRALGGLLHARARGQVGFFRRVIAVVHTAGGRAEIEAALRGDPLVSACFKAEG